MFPVFDVSYSPVASLKHTHKAILNENLQVLLARRTIENRCHQNCLPCVTPICCNVFESSSVKNDNTLNEIKNCNCNLPFNRGLNSLPNFTNVPFFPPLSPSRMPETSLPTNQISEQAITLKVEENCLSQEVTNRAKRKLSVEAPNSTKHSRMSTLSSTSSSDCPVLNSPVTPQVFPYCEGVVPRPSESSFPPSQIVLPPAFWKLSNIMLANHLINSRFFQTVNNSLQSKNNAQKIESKSSKMNHLEESTRRKKNSCNIATSKTFEQNQSLSKIQTMESNIVENKPFVPSKTNVFSRLQNGFPSIVSDPKNCSGANDFYQLPFIASALSSNSASKSAFTRKDLKEALHKEEKTGAHSFNQFFTPVPGDIVPPTMFFPWNNKPYLPAPKLFCPKSTFSHNLVNRKNASSSAHLEPHSGGPMKEKRSHRCCYCGKLYSRKYGLKIHIRTHTGYKPLKCKICGRPFGDPSNLNKHVRLHAEGATPYRCQFCGKVLVRRRDLERHINSRHPERKESITIGNSAKCPPADPRLWSAK